MSSTTERLRNQWVNPGDILSLLLLIGGDIVQKAIAQLVGYKLRLPGKRTPVLFITPVAFSFGWAAFAFTNLMRAIGDMRLMPTNDNPSILVSCSNGFVRETRSWVLGRLLRDHEIKRNVDTRPAEEGGRGESIRIDIFNLGPASRPNCDFVWWVGWAAVFAQIVIAVIPCVLYSDYGVMMITLSGNLLAMITCSMPQWAQEKWPGPKIEHEKVTCLTRGNGHLRIMVFIGAPGSWDLEYLSTGTSVARPETRWISLLLAILWTCLLISISGLTEHTWFLVWVGGIGMLQNVFAAGKPRESGASDLHITPFVRAPVIIGKRGCYKDDPDANVDLEADMEGLADVNSWATQEPQLLPGHNYTSTTERIPMPRWLISMSNEDGVPSWLESAKPTRINESADDAKSASRCFKTSVRLWSPRGDTPKTVIHAVGVQGALVELEKWVPTAGLAMVQIFFPGGLKYNDNSIRGNIYKKFWQRAYYTKSIRKRAEERRRVKERNAQVLTNVGQSL
ncbi:hypothetical protein F5B20DRAFT_373581 [Whalleya microplaca]|nr:hypothetical protein F5B20DRAFT_373581 [Whalleya microplaca]